MADTNKQLFEKVRQLNLPKGKYALFGSAPLGARGLKDCRDIDIVVSKDIFTEFSQKQGWEKKQMPHSSVYLINGHIELWHDWKPGEWDIDSLIKHAELINGLPFVELEEVLRWKRLNAREKDLVDIKIIENYLNLNQKRIFGVNKNVFWLGLVSFFNDFSSEMIYSVLPVFFLQVLHVGPEALGMVEGIAEGFSNILKAFSGRFSDFIKKRKLLAVLGYVISVLTRPFYVFTQKVTGVLELRVIDRVGKGLRDSPRDALIADSVKNEELGKSFGFQRALDTLGATLGPLSAFLILGVFSLGFNYLFLTAFFIGIFAILSFIWVREHEFFNKESLKLFGFNFKELPKDFYFWLVSVFILSLGAFPMALVLLRAPVSGIKVIEIPLIYFIFSLSYVIFSTPAGALADKIGFRKTIVIGYIFAVISYFIFAAFNQEWLIILSFIILGVFYAFSDGINRAFAGKLVKEEKLRGTALGLSNMAVGIGVLIGGVVGGYLWQKISYVYAFSWAGVMIVLGLLIFSLYFFNGARTENNL